MTDEELDRLLAAPPPDPPDPSWLQRSQAQLPRPRRWGGWLAAAGLFAGTAAGWLLHAALVPTPPPQIIERIVEVPAPVPPSAATVHHGPVVPTLAELDQREAQAELADPPEAARLYQEIGDWYLLRCDYAAAARCYRLHLEIGGEAARQRNQNDSWLLLTMKPVSRTTLPLTTSPLTTTPED